MNDLVIKENEQLKGLEENKAQHIKDVFDPMMDKLVEVEEAYNNIVSLELTPGTCVLAKRMRLDIAQIRIAAGKIKDEQKKEILIAGNAIQGIYNIIKFAVVSKEDKLKDIELHYEKIEEEKKKQLQINRQDELAKYDADGEFVDLGNMPDEVWNNYLAGVKNNFESIKEAKRKAESDRIALEKKEAQYDGRLKALLIYGDYFDSSKLTIDSTESDFEQILMDAKTGRTAYLNEQKKIKAENERLKKESDKKEKTKKIKDQKEKKEKDRMDKMFSLNLKFDGQSFIYKDINFHWTDLLCMTDETFDKAFKGAKDRKAILDDEEAENIRLEKEAADRLKAEQKKAANAPDKEKLSVLVDVIAETRLLINDTGVRNYLHIIITDMQSYTDNL